ncbi:uncharacterized protein LOC108682851 [Hyalella azteca]|uniref:Uncharacterized protein LOC108682851 n=1 Tax=Hyalella azteca TaxID=294128 RepID=A0A979FFV5_HYAAZ|nr:uncharacterized protein LOC108682851 [Hyalella azteca]
MSANGPNQPPLLPLLMADAILQNNVQALRNYDELHKFHPETVGVIKYLNDLLKSKLHDTLSAVGARNNQRGRNFFMNFLPHATDFGNLARGLDDRFKARQNSRWSTNFMNTAGLPTLDLTANDLTTSSEVDAGMETLHGTKTGQPPTGAEDTFLSPLNVTDKTQSRSDGTGPIQEETERYHDGTTYEEIYPGIQDEETPYAVNAKRQLRPWWAGAKRSQGLRNDFKRTATNSDLRSFLKRQLNLGNRLMCQLDVRNC